MTHHRLIANNQRARLSPARGTALLLAGAAIALVQVVGHGGCALWRGELDPHVQRRIEKRLHQVTSARLNPAARGRPVTVEDALASSGARGDQSTTSPTASSPSTLVLGLDDVRKNVLENNLDLQVQVVQPEIARAQISEEAARFDATIGIGAYYKKKDLPAGLGDPYQISDKSSLAEKTLKGLGDAGQGAIDAAADALGLKKSGAKSAPPDLNGKIITLNDIEQQKREIGADAGVSMTTPLGTQLRALQSFNRLEKLSPFSDEQDSAAARFSVSQPLLRNAGPDVNVASIRIARLNSHAETAKLRLFTIRLLASAEKSYWQLDAARRIVEIRRKLLNVAESNLDIARKRAAEGLIAPIETVRAEVGAALQREAVIVAETQARIQERELKRILNIPGTDIASPTVIEPASKPQLIYYALDTKRLANDAIGNRIEMLELELALAADDLRIGFARNQTLPAISLDFEYGLLDRAGSPASAWRDSWDFDTGDYAIGIKGEIPVTNELRKAQLRKAVLTRQQRLATRSARELVIRQEVLDAIDVLNQNWQRIIAARQTVIAAGRTYEAELRQFDQGGRTMREVYEALAQLGDAQAREANAVLAYQISLIDVAFATGTLLGHARVDFNTLTPREITRSDRTRTFPDAPSNGRVFADRLE